MPRAIPPGSTTGRGYHNPLRNAQVTPERIDQGVDFSVQGGWLEAIADCVMTENYSDAWAPYGAFCSYRITQPGPLYGRFVFYAEGVQGIQQVGRRLSGGDGVCQLIPGWQYGIEIGWAAGSGARTLSYLLDGPYADGCSTRCGISFSRLLQALGAPGGVLQSCTTGRDPGISLAGITRAPGTDTPSSTPAPSRPPALQGSSGLPPVSDYDPSPIIAHILAGFGLHGQRAIQNAQAVDQMVQGTRYVTEAGPHP